MRNDVNKIFIINRCLGDTKMNFFVQGKLGQCILKMSLDGLWMLVKFSPPNDSWMRGESLTEIVKRIALLENRQVDAVMLEVKTIRKQIDC